MPRRDAPDLGALDRFLVASPPTAPDGRILSWLGPDAYPYDEATALLARHYAWSDQPSRLTRLVGVLEGRVALSGGLGRDGVLYAFDTALALPVLGAGRTRARDLVLALFEDAAAARPTSAPERWSEAFGPHLLKAFAALTPAERPPHLVNRFAALAGRCQTDGAFRAHPERPGVYLHAHCYATRLRTGAPPTWWRKPRASSPSWIPGAIRPRSSARWAAWPRCRIP